MDDLAINPPGSGRGDMETARTGYESALNYSTLNQNIIWSVFNTMLVANSIVVTGIGIIHSTQTLMSFFQIFLPLMGILLCLIWFMLVQRHLQLSIFFLFSAREIEECYLKDTLRTFHNGGKFSDGEPVTLTIDGKEKKCQMGFPEKIVKGRISLYGIIVIFTLFYFAAFFF
jgi:hypothetical protein